MLITLVTNGNILQWVTIITIESFLLRTYLFKALLILTTLFMSKLFNGSSIIYTFESLIKQIEEIIDNILC